MKEIFKDFLLKDPWFYILLLFSISFLAAGFIAPPLGSISPSVLTAVGELFAWGVLGTIIKAIDKGVGAKLEKGDIKLTVGDDSNINENE